MQEKTLVVYATRCGSTVEVAEAIGKTLREQGQVVDVRPVKDVTGVKDYQTVIVGSAVRFGQWLPEAVKFVEQNQSDLAGRKTVYFAAHLMNQGEDETSQKARSMYLDAARKLVAPKGEAFFAGVGDPSKLGFFERLIGKMVKSPEGDFRDWDAIRAWAKTLA